jgi:hypothetical protein
MAHVTIDDTTGADQVPPGGPSTPVPGSTPPKGRRRLLWRILIGLGVVVVVLVAAGAAWWTFGRDDARQVSTDEVLEQFRQSGAAGSDGEGRPAVGVYAATATGSEDIGVPGLTESFGPGAPVTVTHGGEGCFTYRADFNSHHWRSWTFCSGADAVFALTATDSATTRDIPGLDLDSLTTFTCETPLPFLWTDAAVGDRREGSCTGISDVIEGPTSDAGVVEVLGTPTLTIGGVEVPTVHVRSTDTFGGSQTGTEVDEWWIDARTGLPLKVIIDSKMTSSHGDYIENGTLELTTLEPTT